jgi:hypothetical protein
LGSVGARVPLACFLRSSSPAKLERTSRSFGSDFLSEDVGLGGQSTRYCRRAGVIWGRSRPSLLDRVAFVRFCRFFLKTMQ